jgi:hypothetical protein
LKETDEANLTKTDHPLGWLLTVLQKEHADKEVIRTALIEAMSHINTLGDEQVQQRQRAISYLFLLILHRRPAEEHEELSTLVDQHIQQASDREEVEVMAQTMAEHLIERGKEQGETQAKQEALLKLIRFQFESVPESVTNEITLIQSLSHLDLLFEKAMTAWALNEIDLQNRDG